MNGTREATTGPELQRVLGSRQVRMIGLGGAIGTGLFLGSGLALSMAGPSVIIAYAAGAVLALALAYALAEMTVVHPRAGGFGAVAHTYLGPWAGFVQRWMYWVAQVVNIGSEVTAAGMYVRFWWPQLPLWVPVVFFSVAMLLVNAASVRFFGEFEYWFAMIKIVTISVFVLLGIAFITVGLPGSDPVGLAAWTGDGGFAPGGITGLWLAMTVVTFGYMGTEAVALTAAESRDPARDIPRAARGMVLRLALFYVLAMAIVVSIVPLAGRDEGGVGGSPFVQLFVTAGIPGAVAVMNFVVLTAALSAMNTNLYVSARMVHSLAKDGYAPRRLTALNAKGAPVNALLFSAAGLTLATVLAVVAPDTAFALLVGIATFGALVTWLLIFATQWAFRRTRQARGLEPSPIRLPGTPVTTALAMLAVVAVLVTMAFTEQFAPALYFGIPFLVLLLAAYGVLHRRRAARANPAVHRTTLELSTMREISDS
ncbi:amino acid permease [Streptomyces sp. NPDC053048]|uniref:amino acid permease n=1 Tax=Streptomyces sp. NPDC053048 TaxID=3365694 RepID=UPI0037CFF261